MSLDDELEELKLNPTDRYASQRLIVVAAEIAKRDHAYDTFLKEKGEVVCQADGMQAIRYAFQQGWESGNDHGRNQANQRHREEQGYYR